jgi:hypothetical protein
VEPATAGQLGYELAGLSKLPAGLSSGGNGSIQAQAALLTDPRLQTAQRQALADQIGWMQGNRHLQRVAVQAGVSGPRHSDPGPPARLPVTPMRDAQRVSRNENGDDEPSRGATTTTPAPQGQRYERGYRFVNRRLGRYLSWSGELRFVPRSAAERRAARTVGAGRGREQQRLTGQIQPMPYTAAVRDMSGRAAEISRAAMEAEGTLTIAPELRVTVSIAALEAQLARRSGERLSIDPNLAKLSIRLEGYLNEANADVLLGSELADRLRQSMWNLRVRLQIEAPLQPQHLRQLSRYNRALRRFNEAGRELDDVLRRVERDRTQLQQTREQIRQASRQMDDLARRQPRTLRGQVRQVAHRQRVWQQRRALRDAERQLIDSIESQQRRAGQLGRAVQAADSEVEEAAAQASRRLGGVRNRLGRSVLGRLGKRVWMRIIPIIGAALFVYDLYETARYIYALATGRAGFGTEQGAERAAERPAESLEEARPGAGEEGRGGDIEERVHVPGAEEDIGGGGTSRERIEGAEETEGAGEPAPEGEREPEETEEEAPAAEAEGEPGGGGPTEEAPEEAEEAIPAGAEVSEWEFAEEELVEARPAEARGEGFRSFLENADAQMAAYGCAVRFVPLEDIYRVEVGQQIQGMAAVRIEGGQVIGGYPVTCTIDTLQQVDGGSRITAISLSPFDGFDAEGNFVAEVPSARIAIEMATGRAPREEEEQLEGTTTDLPQDVAREERAVGR